MSAARRLVAPLSALLLVAAAAGDARGASPPHLSPLAAVKKRIPSRIEVPGPVRQLVGLAHALSPHPKVARAKWRREKALIAIEKAVHTDPRLERAFEEHYAHLGGRSLWSARDAMVMLGIGSLVNFGGYLQPELLVPYLVAGVAVDVTTFSTRTLGVANMRRRTIRSMIEDGSVPEALVTPHREALERPAPAERAATARSHARGARRR